MANFKRSKYQNQRIIAALTIAVLPATLLLPLGTSRRWLGESFSDGSRRWLGEDSSDEASTTFEIIQPWPTTDTGGIIPTGNYAFHKDGNENEHHHSRVLIYITTHFSDQHELFLRYCWKNILSRSTLLRDADVAVFLNPNEDKRRNVAMDLLRDVFADHHRLVAYVRDYAGMLLEGGPPDMNDEIRTKQSGAVMAMYEAVHHGYFEGYDWIVRVNPDVLIRDDSWLMDSMASPDLMALIVNCHQGREGGTDLSLDDHLGMLLHTDFFAVRPEMLRSPDFPRRIYDTPLAGAEMTFTAALRDEVLRSDNDDDGSPQRYAWVPGADPASKSVCRVGEGRDWFDSPVVHEHYLHPDVCTVPEGEAGRVEEVFSEGWPHSWRPVDGIMAAARV